LGRRKATKLDQARLVRVQRQRKLLQSVTQIRQKSLGVCLMLEADDDIVGVAHQGNLAAGLVVSPPFSPQIENVV
jgi:hypothetical protein